MQQSPLNGYAFEMRAYCSVRELCSSTTLQYTVYLVLLYSVLCNTSTVQYHGLLLDGHHDYKEELAPLN